MSEIPKNPDRNAARASDTQTPKSDKKGRITSFTRYWSSKSNSDGRGTSSSIEPQSSTQEVQGIERAQTQSGLSKRLKQMFEKDGPLRRMLEKGRMLEQAEIDSVRLNCNKVKAALEEAKIKGTKLDPETYESVKIYSNTIEGYNNTGKVNRSKGGLLRFIEIGDRDVNELIDANKKQKTPSSDTASKAPLTKDQSALKDDQSAFDTVKASFRENLTLFENLINDPVNGPEALERALTYRKVNENELRKFLGKCAHALQQKVASKPERLRRATDKFRESNDYLSKTYDAAVGKGKRKASFAKQDQPSVSRETES